MPLDPAQDPAPIEIAGYVGAAIGWSPVPEHIVTGARVGRGPIAGVFEGRVALQPDALQPLPLTLAVISDAWGGQSNLASLQDVVGGALVVEVGVPAFSPRFTGGPYAQAGLDLALVRKSTIALDQEFAVAGFTEDLPMFGARLAAGANFSLGKHASVRAQITDTVRPTSYMLVTTQPTADGPLLVNDILFTFTVLGGARSSR